MRTKPGRPMSLANMRQNDVRAVIATCESCNRSADVNTRPAWHTARDAWGPSRQPALMIASGSAGSWHQFCAFRPHEEQ
jgi:hypothetical protein